MHFIQQLISKTIIGILFLLLVPFFLQAQNSSIVTLYNADSTFVGTGVMKNNQMDGLWRFENPKTGILIQTSNFVNGAREGITVAYHDGKIKRLEAEYKQNKLNGTFREFDTFGNPRLELVFKDSIPVGPYREYFPKTSRASNLNPNVVKIEGNYVNGKKDGVWLTYFNTLPPTIAIKETYQAGELNGSYQEFDFDGNLMLEVAYVNGKPEGDFKRYAGPRMIWEEGQFKNGRKVGEWKAYFPGSKTLESEKFYDERGNKVGTWTFYYENKRTARIEKYENDIPVGTWEEFFPNRNLAKRKTYELGVPVGEYIEYHSDGSVSVSGQYKGGVKDGLWKNFFPDGELYSIGEYKNDLKTGLWKYFNKIGILIAEGEYSLGSESGQWFYYYDGGQLKSVGSYFLGFEQGTWGLFYDNKQLTQEEFWSNGRLMNVGDYYAYDGSKTLNKGTLKDGNGTRITYYIDGRKESEGNYKGGKPEGKWSYYHENGRIASEGQMIDGKKEGVWRYFNMNGRLEQVITFKDDEVVTPKGPEDEIKFKTFED
ncbi:toxin-antitoxin system YwqK family antitoxin [Belliella pelovolcani]|uniref:toxin-antitoxin system YwqK family antitoxin n=1 Tax=Belliella pelovolcani TaxID=529505 RepID=UPI003919433A